MKRQITRKSLDELARELQTLSPEEQERYYGGGDGTKESPYTYEEFRIMESSGIFRAGYIDVGGGTIIYGEIDPLNTDGTGGSFITPEVEVFPDTGVFGRRPRDGWRPPSPDDSGSWIAPPIDPDGFDSSAGGGGGGRGSAIPRNIVYNDVSRPEFWVHQAPNECYQACLAIMRKYGIAVHDSTKRMLLADQHGKVLEAHAEGKEATAYIRSELAAKRPIIVGVDDTLRTNTKNHHRATEHFIVIVSDGVDDEGRYYFRYFDVGSGDRSRGTSLDNRLYLEAGNLWQAKVSAKKTYTITEVRKNRP